MLGSMAYGSVIRKICFRFPTFVGGTGANRTQNAIRCCSGTAASSRQAETVIDRSSILHSQEVTTGRPFLVGLDPIHHPNVSESVKRTLDLRNASQPEINKFNIQQAIKKFQRFPGDTGSSEVQIAILTEKVHYMEKHLRENRQDKHSRRGLVAMLSKRTTLLKYLRKKNFSTYKELLYQLNLKDVIRQEFEYPQAKHPAKPKPGKYADPPKPMWGTKVKKQRETARKAIYKTR